MKENYLDIQGIIFDLDGTLYRMRWYMRPLLVCKVFPTSLRLPKFLKERGEFAGRDMGSRDNLLSAVCEATSIKERCAPEKIHSWVQNSFYPSFVSIMRYFRNSRPGLNKTMSMLRDSGIILGVLSDYDFVQQRLELLNISTTNFKTMTSSEASGALKPCPRPFLEIAKQWDLQPENILVIGDRDDTDGEAARAAGMRFLHIADSKSSIIKAHPWRDIKNMLESISKKQYFSQR
jgi:HAD superfamily hydrolase (TIGR01549 family)